VRGRPPVPPELVSGAQLREAEKGFLAMLYGRNFPHEWIERNAIDMLAQASSEYAAWLKNHEPEPNPVGWLVTCAYRRALNLLEYQRRRPPTTSIDAALHLADEGCSTPEQEVLDHDRQQRLRAAMECLRRQDRKLLSLVYFEERSVREAGRRLGWGKSTADRRHRAALDQLRSIVGDRGLLSPSGLGVAAWVAASAERRLGVGSILGAASAVPQGIAEVVTEAARRVAAAARRLLPFVESGSVAASGGVGRTVGACGAGLAAALCGLAVIGVEPPSLPGAESKQAPRQVQVQPSLIAPNASGGSTNAVAKAPSDVPESASGSRARPQESRGATSPLSRARVVRARPPAGHPEGTQSTSTPDQVNEEFGIEGSVEEERAQAQPEAPDSTEPSVSQPHSVKPVPKATGAQVNEEFGL
jgi:RNA polymerase sigma factor (sigma-70 family)